MKIPELEERISKLGRVYEIKCARLEDVNNDIKNSQLPQLLKTRKFIHFAAQETAQDVENKMGKIITTAIESLAEKQYRFNIEFNVRRNTTEADIFLTLPNSKKHYKVLETVGGGISDMISLAFQSAYVVFSDSDPIIVLDEPFKFISSNWQRRAGKFIQRLSKKLGLQFIIVTHEEELYECADNLINLDELQK